MKTKRKNHTLIGAEGEEKSGKCTVYIGDKKSDDLRDFNVRRAASIVLEDDMIDGFIATLETFRKV